MQIIFKEEKKQSFSEFCEEHKIGLEISKVKNVYYTTLFYYGVAESGERFFVDDHAKPVVSKKERKKGNIFIRRGNRVGEALEKIAKTIHNHKLYVAHEEVLVSVPNLDLIEFFKKHQSFVQDCTQFELKEIKKQPCSIRTEGDQEEREQEDSRVYMTSLRECPDCKTSLYNLPINENEGTVFCSGCSKAVRVTQPCPCCSSRETYFAHPIRKPGNLTQAQNHLRVTKCSKCKTAFFS